MDAFGGDEASQQLQELAADLDMILPSSGYVNPSNEEPIHIAQEEQRLGQDQSLLRGSTTMPSRPGIRREGSVPAPSQPPPAPPPMMEPPQPTDSLSLMQLRSLVREMPKVEPTPYAFEYQDASSLPEEIEEWFAYTTPERANILRAQSCFANEWGVFNGWVSTGDEESSLDWNKASENKRNEFMQTLLRGLMDTDIDRRLEQLEALVYVVLGCWHETAGLEAGNLTLEEASILLEKENEARNTGGYIPPTGNASSEAQKDKVGGAAYSKSGFQLEWLRMNTKMLINNDGLQAVFDTVRTACFREWYNCLPEMTMLSTN